jgi:hypothetical protein
MAEMESAELFDLPLSLLGWLPGETLFSLVSRQHAFWGYASAGETAYILFGQRHAGIHHDFPSSLDELFARTDGVLGVPDELALNRTLLSYYRPFASERLIADCIQMMRGKSVSHLKYRLGLLTSRFRANHPLKACSACMEQDRHDAGWAYWHLEHQYPGVWFCEPHGEPLYESTVKSTGVNRFQWSLPNRCNLTRDWVEGVTDASALKKLSSMTLNLFRRNRSPGWLDGAHVVPVLRDAILQRGWLTPNGNLRSSALAPSYLDWCQSLRGPLELDALPRTPSEASSQLGRLLRTWRSGTHPLRVLVAASWLFDDAESFIVAYGTVHGSQTQSPTIEQSGRVSTPLSTVNNDAVKAQLVAQVRAGMSATAAASAIGVTVGTVMAWLAQANLKVARRPKTLKTGIQESLKIDLERGMDKSTAATTHGVSVQAVTRFLRTEPSLHQTWQDAVFRNMQINARSSWSAALAKYGHLGSSWIRAQDPSIYAWLYRNDRVWLQSNQPQVLARSTATAHVNWDQRDLALSAAAEQVLERLTASQPKKPLQLWQIYQAMPQLKPKLSVLEKLPLTRRVLERALGRTRTKPQKDLL